MDNKQRIDLLKYVINELRNMSRNRRCACAGPPSYLLLFPRDLSVLDADFSALRAVEHPFRVRAGQNRLHGGNAFEKLFAAGQIQLAHHVVEDQNGK